VKRDPDIYLAAKFDAKERIRIERDRIHALKLGHVVSCWLEEEQAAPPEGTQGHELPASVAREYAARDLWEVWHCDLLILDTFDDNMRGGREVEFGMALAAGIEVWVVGPKRNVFHELAPHFDSWADVLEALIAEKSRRLVRR
jgi:nucleoside 2-deoxyribosyltransferase